MPRPAHTSQVLSREKPLIIPESTLPMTSTVQTATTMWLSDTTPQPTWIKYEFDKIYKLQEMWVWNSNQTVETSFGFGIKSVTIEYSTDGY